MIMIDTSVDIAIEKSSAGKRTVRLPILGHISQGWLALYQTLADRASISARIKSLPEQCWVIVTLPTGTGDDEALRALDVAVHLLDETDRAFGSSEALNLVSEIAIRDWWANQRTKAETDVRSTHPVAMDPSP